MLKKLLFMALFLFIAHSSVIYAGNTGKLSGRITDAETGEALVGINVRLDGTTLGASTDINGNYIVNNIPPAEYKIIVSGIGYQSKQIIGVKISTDFTYKLDIQLSSEAITTETVVIKAEAPLVRKDLTSSQTNVDADQIQSLPVESVNQILSLQAGIVQGAGGELHIKGGRSTEVSYTINGVSISNPFDNSRSVQISTNAIQELSVVSGTFNAEYGNALSGVVNTVTKEGGNKLNAFLSFYTGDYLSSHKNIFTNIDDINPVSNNVSEITLGGPVPFTNDKLTFFTSARYDYSNGYLYGVHQFNPGDSVYKSTTDEYDIKLFPTGDGKYVPMNPSQDLIFTGKLTVKPFSTLKINYDMVYSDSYWRGYSHDLKYNPEANYKNYEWGWMQSAEIRHALNNSTFYTLRGFYNTNDYKQYLYPLLDASGNAVDFHPGMNYLDYFVDPRYENQNKILAIVDNTFSTGGTQNGHYYQRTYSYGGKFDITSQMNNNHELKLGTELRLHELMFENFTIVEVSNKMVIPGVDEAKHSRYAKFPAEFSAYVQDKMEYESIIINAGLRFDYFDSKSKYSVNSTYPSDRDPQLPAYIDPSTLFKTASAKYMLSPRFGISFPITDKGIIHFSYGHFYQIPPFRYLFTNPDFKSDYSTGAPTFGNANLNPEKTVTYELGLQQQLTESIAFNVTGYFKDVRDLLALQQIRVDNSRTYTMYVNKDYGNIKGLTFSLNKRRSSEDFLGASLDYTFQVAEGNETNSDAFFQDLKSGRQSEKLPVFLDWDQTHTLNASVSFGQQDWNVTLVGRLGTGLPYTPLLLEGQIYLPTNSERRPSQASVDLMAEKSFSMFDVTMTLFFKVFNLFDTLNERLIYSDTGTAGYTLEKDYGSAQNTNRLAQRIPGLHSADEYFVRPNYYSAPREFKLGLSLEF